MEPQVVEIRFYAPAAVWEDHYKVKAGVCLFVPLSRAST